MNRIAALVIGHVLAVLGLGVWMGLTDRSAPPPATLIVSYGAAAFSECGLLAFWLALGLSSRKKRAWTSLAGVVYLWLVLLALQPDAQADAVIILAVLVVGCILSLALVLFLASRWRLGFCLKREHADSFRGGAVQFSLRHLFLFTVAVSLVLAGAELIETFTSAGVVTGALVCIVIVVCFVEATLSAFWASLGQGRMPIKIAAAIALAAGTGVIPPFYFRGHLSDYALAVGITTLAQVITVASLIIVRSAGFRLVRGAAVEADSEEPAELVAHPLD